MRVQKHIKVTRNSNYRPRFDLLWNVKSKNQQARPIFTSKMASSHQHQEQHQQLQQLQPPPHPQPHQQHEQQQERLQQQLQQQQKQNAHDVFQAASPVHYSSDDEQHFTITYSQERPRPTTLEPTTTDRYIQPVYSKLSARKLDRVTPNCNRPTTPNSNRRSCNPIFLRRITSMGSNSSGEDSPFRQHLRHGFANSHVSSSPEPSPNSQTRNSFQSRPVAFVVGTPRMHCTSNSGATTEDTLCSRTILSEVNRDLENCDDNSGNGSKNRPPSPRPAGELQTCVEHNKQLHVWDDWVTMSNTEPELPVASISFKRVESERHMMMKPKSLPRMSDDEDSDADVE